MVKPPHQLTLTCMVRSWWHRFAYNPQCKLRSCQSPSLSPRERNGKHKKKIDKQWSAVKSELCECLAGAGHYFYLVSLLHGAHLQFTDGLFGSISQTPLLTRGQLNCDSGSLYKEGYTNVGRVPGKFIGNNSWRTSKEAGDLWLRKSQKGWLVPDWLRSKWSQALMTKKSCWQPTRRRWGSSREVLEIIKYCYQQCHTGLESVPLAKGIF